MQRLSFLFLSFSLASCALFKAERPVTDLQLEWALDAVRVTGEGRGRLQTESSSHVFSFEAVLRDDADWILAVTVPLRGEETMVLPKLTEAEAPEESLESFEAHFKDRETLWELRSLIRFVLATPLKLGRQCEPVGENRHNCFLSTGDKQDPVEVEVAPDKIFIRKMGPGGRIMELTAQNLTDSFFTRSTFSLHSQKSHNSSAPLLSLELFWK